MKISEKEKKSYSGPRESKDQIVSWDFSEVIKQLQEMFKKASEAGNDVSKMFPRCLTLGDSDIPENLSLSSIYSKMTPQDTKTVEDFGSNYSNLSSTLKKIFMWEKKLYQEVKILIANRDQSSPTSNLAKKR